MLTVVLGAAAYLMPAQMTAEIAPTETLTDSECSKEILLSYFPEIFVRETLAKFNVPKEKWDGIVSALAEKNKIVIKTVEEKASKLSNSPLKDPQQRQAAVKLFRDTILEIFSDVLKDNGITDEKQIQAMLDDIQQQTARRFAACIKRAEVTAKADDLHDESADDLNDESDEDEDSDEDGDDDDKELSEKKAEPNIKVEIDSHKK